MKQRFRFVYIVIGIIVLIGVFVIGDQIAHYRSNSQVSFVVRGDQFLMVKDGKEEPFFIKGVNLGAGKPGAFPGDMGVSKEEYARWFQQIADLNANTIRVYTILSPEFYDALFEHNINSDKPIYLFQGLWLNEETIAEFGQSYAPRLMEEIQAEAEKIVDLLHGNRTIPEALGHAAGPYRFDVSPFVAGYILGIELDAAHVAKTNLENPEKSSFEGEFLRTENATPHEAFLAWMGETVLKYEYETYGVQKCMSFTNWLTTDPMAHTNEPDPKEDGVSVDTEHIKPTAKFTAGLFASYHVYPYYPEFMGYQPEYVEYIDSRGKQNPYMAYLLDLKAHHTVPVLVAEFGIPSSRGVEHVNPITHYDQGGISEVDQGLYVADMMQDIYDAGMAGGLIFTWQDEWFKRSWNTMDFDIETRRPFWANYQVAEQSYGLLAFDPGANGDKQVDGDLKEWRNASALSQAGGAALFATHDERFLYLHISDPAMQPGETYVIGADTIVGQGNSRYTDREIDFANAVDFAIVIAEEESSAIRVDAYYDSYAKFYTLLDIIAEEDFYRGVPNSGVFNPMRLIISDQFDLPLGGHVPVQLVETGKLKLGNSNPESPNYDSLADYYRDDARGIIELRIPWQLLNVTDPSTRQVMADFAAQTEWELQSVAVEGLSLELHAQRGGGREAGAPGLYTWETWRVPTYHERLKPSYYIVAECFSNY